MGAFEQDCQSYKLIAGVAEKQAKGLLAKDLDADITAQLRPQEPPIPTRKRYIVNDLTYEKLGVILAENPDGILSVRDEIRGLLQHLSREEQAQARAFYLQSWSGGSYTFDRIMRGTTTIEDVRLSVIGCIQPGPVGELILNARRGASDDGMLERFLACWPDGTGAWKEVDRWPDTQAKLAARQTFARLGMV